DRDAVTREGVKRSINRAAIEEEKLFDAFAEPASIPARIASRFVPLLEQRTNEPAFHPNAPQHVVPLDPRVFAPVRTARHGGSGVLCLVNVTADEVSLSVPLEAAGWREGSPGAARDLLSGRTFEPTASALDVTLRPYDALWLKR